MTSSSLCAIEAVVLDDADDGWHGAKRNEDEDDELDGDARVGEWVRGFFINDEQIAWNM